MIKVIARGASLAAYVLVAYFAGWWCLLVALLFGVVNGLRIREKA